MSIVTDLLEKPGVMGAGVYTYKSELSDYRGEIPQELASIAAVMCNSATTSATMASDMVEKFDPQTGLHPVQGWVMRGPQYTLCVMANVFCFVTNEQGSLNAILNFMRQSLADKMIKLV